MMNRFIVALTLSVAAHSASAQFSPGQALGAAQLNSAFAAKAPIASPSFTGSPTAPTPSAGDSSTALATTSFVANSIASGYLPIQAPQVNYPIQAIQPFGPTTGAAQQSLAGLVGSMWSSGYTAQPGVFSMSYAPAYRLFFTPTGWSGSGSYTSSNLDWLYYNHPDWIMYGSDGGVQYQFGVTTYPVVDVSNPAVMSYMAQAMIQNASGYQALALDNVGTRNVANTGGIYQVGHYAGTTAPCPAASRPACGGTFVTQYTSQGDPNWIPVNLAYMKYMSAQAKAAGLSTVANLSYQGGQDFVNVVNAVSGIVVENVPQHSGSSTATDWYNGFLIDDLFQSNLYNAANASQKFYAALSYLNGHDTSAITQAEESYATAWMLLVSQNAAQNYLYAGQSSVKTVEAYPPSMGGYFNSNITATWTTSSTTVTVASTSGLVGGLKVSGAGIMPGTYIASITNGTTFVLSTTPYVAGTSATLNISGFAPLPIGEPVTPPPQVNPNTTPPTGVCGWVNGANAGACTRQYSNGWVFVNPVCQYNGSTCSVASNPVTIPTPSSGQWYDQFCNVVAAGTYTLNAASALVIARGATSSCPWPKP